MFLAMFCLCLFQRLEPGLLCTQVLIFPGRKAQSKIKNIFLIRSANLDKSVFYDIFPLMLPVLFARCLLLVSSTLPPPTPPPDAHAPVLRSPNSTVTWQRGPSWTQHQPCCHGNGSHTRRHAIHIGFLEAGATCTTKATCVFVSHSVQQHPIKKQRSD